MAKNFPRKFEGVKPIYSKEAVKSDSVKDLNSERAHNHSVKKNCVRPPLIKKTCHPLLNQETPKEQRLPKGLTYSFKSDLKVHDWSYYVRASARCDFCWNY
ncbi:hypothetical protein HHI36_009483 [Cryptolaemus montrouzieri]|uniref:Uncharacterized protein n=1 Tax=Cryptolaemus montrouzieri TaxID=559131 RepID=A0ABD2MFV1_9CUCU